MISIDNKKDCCGCSSCEQVCPKNCITMHSDDEGFLYPKIDKEFCIDCHLCEKRCPIHTKSGNSEEYLNSYLARNEGKERQSSSSGGIFVLLAKKILSEGGIVFGAAYDDEWCVHHIAIKSEEELPLLMGSKYLQSRIEESFQEVCNYLNNGKKVLFSGTACQISGLKSYLMKDYDNLWTVDVLCHGAPSPRVWKKYLSELASRYEAQISSVNFRNKNNGWHNYLFHIGFNNGQSYEENFSKNNYMKMFLQNFILRPSCYDCRFKNMNRASDITLGDAWNVENVMPEMDDDMGTSIIVTHTEKGNDILMSISDNLLIKQIELDIILPTTADSRKSVSRPGARRLFFMCFKYGGGINQLMKYVNGGRKTRILSKIIRNK